MSRSDYHESQFLTLRTLFTTKAGASCNVLVDTYKLCQLLIKALAHSTVAHFLITLDAILQFFN